ncbi:PTS transporter subunit EIIB, partial [Staphylococcus pseudintermedius]|uniref:PTS transporter subunit EIIB n=1 Tax=Staphylococcus pseudintermedius TaxID=283734 RepID=UPI002162300E
MLIQMFNFTTPAREDETKQHCLPTNERATTIVQGLRGHENIEIVDCCATRLGVMLKDKQKVNAGLIQCTEPKG